MFERFTDRARQIVVQARAEAGSLNHHYVDTEHLLLGLIHDAQHNDYEPTGAAVLNSLGISLEAVRKQVKRTIGRGRRASPGQIPFTPRAKKVLELSLREAIQLGHHYIGTEHILLGLLAEGEGVAAQVLRRFGCDLAAVRARTVDILANEAGTGQSSSTGVPEASGDAPDRPHLALDHWTNRSRLAINRAKGEARSLGQNCAGLEHILLGLAQEGTAAVALGHLGIDQEELRRTVAEVAGAAGQAVSASEDFTPQATEVINDAWRVARENGASYVDIGHVMVALVDNSEPGGPIDTILARFDRSLRDLRWEALQALPKNNTGGQDDAAHGPAAAGQGQAAQPEPEQSGAASEQPQGTEQPAQGEGPRQEDRPQPGRQVSRFTDRARQVIVLAQEEAGMLHHNYIGTEHILLGLIREGEGLAAKALEPLGISLGAARREVLEIIGEGQHAPSAHIPFTPRVKKVLELSLREAIQLGHHYIGTEHILLGLIREGDGVAAQVIVKLGTNLDRLRERVIQQLGIHQGDMEAEAPRPTSASPGAALSEVLRLAEAEALALGHGYVGTEHLLIASLLVADNGPGIRNLLDDSVTAEAVRELVVSLTKGGGATEPAGTVITLEAADVLDLAEFEAMSCGEAEIAPCHLIVPLATADGSIARRVLWELDVPARAVSLSREPGTETAWGKRLSVLAGLAGPALDASIDVGSG